MMQMRDRCAALLLLLALCSCGEDRAETPYGDAERVAAYRAEIAPLIAEINDIEQALRAMAVGSTDRATGANLAAACQVLDARLVAVLDRLDSVSPPRKLKQMHADMRTAVELRQRACVHIAAGWQIEQDQSFEVAESFYLEAEALLAEANVRLLAVDRVLGEIDVALGQHATSPTA